MASAKARREEFSICRELEAYDVVESKFLLGSCSPVRRGLGEGQAMGAAPQGGSPQVFRR